MSEREGRGVGGVCECEREGRGVGRVCEEGVRGEGGWGAG